MKTESVIEVLEKMKGMVERFAEGGGLKVNYKGLTPGEVEMCTRAINRQIEKLRKEISSKKR